MTNVMIHVERSDSGDKKYRAVAAGRWSTGRTAGEALDSLLYAEGAEPDSTPVLIQVFGPDNYFTQEQHDRMQALLARKNTLSPPEDAELDALIDAELDATVRRTAHLVSPIE